MRVAANLLAYQSSVESSKADESERSLESDEAPNETNDQPDHLREKKTTLVFPLDVKQKQNLTSLLGVGYLLDIEWVTFLNNSYSDEGLLGSTPRPRVLPTDQAHTNFRILLKPTSFL